MFRVKISNEAAPAAIHYLPGFVGHPVHLVHVDAEGVLHCVNHHVHLSKKILYDKTALIFNVCSLMSVRGGFCTAIFRVLRQNFAVKKGWHTLTVFTLTKCNRRVSSYVENQSI